MIIIRDGKAEEVSKKGWRGERKLMIR